MPGRSKSHSAAWWASGAKPGVRRCNAMLRSGSQCLRVAEQGSVVCDKHGGLAPQVQRRAKERMAVVSDAIVEQLLSWLYDDTVPVALKVKIAQDVLDRAGVDRSAKVVVGIDPVETLFRDLLDRDDALEDVDPRPALPPAPLDGPVEDDDGALMGSYVGGDFWDGPPPEPEPDVIEAEVIDETPAWLRPALREGRTE